MRCDADRTLRRNAAISGSAPAAARVRGGQCMPSARARRLSPWNAFCAPSCGWLVVSLYVVVDTGFKSPRRRIGVSAAVAGIRAGMAMGGTAVRLTSAAGSAFVPGAPIFGVYAVTILVQAATISGAVVDRGTSSRFLFRRSRSSAFVLPPRRLEEHALQCRNKHQRETARSVTLVLRAPFAVSTGRLLRST